MRIAVTGGKGGTGKSIIATALASELVKTDSVVLVDADVECPNDHLLLSIDLEKVEDVKINLPEIDPKKCIKCGKCSEVCRENAFVFVKDRLPIFIEEQCTGCMACKLVCPAGAIKKKPRVIGYIYEGEKDKVNLVSGKLLPGRKESSPLVHALNDHVKNSKKDFQIFDTAAGSSCPVIGALMDSDLAIAVTEPTPLGANDLRIILQLLEQLDIPKKIILNKTGIGSEKEIENIAEEFNTLIVARVPYSKKIMEDYSQGKPIETPEIKRFASRIEVLE